MLKKLSTAAVITCFSASCYAYGINSTLTIENHTGAPLLVTVEDLPFQKSEPAHVAAHGSSTINLTIGGWELHKYYSAPFTVKSDDADQKLYVQGRVAYYVGWWPTEQYSFLDSVSSTQGLKLDSTYSCFPGNSSFENKIVINGTPEKGMEAITPPAEIHCRGLKSSVMGDKHETYTPTCSDGIKTATFAIESETHNGHEQNNSQFAYRASGKELIWADSAIRWPNDKEIQTILDTALNEDPKTYRQYLYVNKFCGSW